MDGGGAAVAAGKESAEAASKRAEAAEAEAEAARAEAQRLGAENARLLETLARASSDDGGGASDGGPTLDTTGSGKGGAFRPAFERMSTRLPDPLRERALFAAVGFDVMTKGYSQPDMVKLRELLAAGIVNLNCRDGKGSPPLSHAAWNGHEEAVLLLLSHGADVDAANLDDSTPSTFVCSIGRAALQRYCSQPAPTPQSPRMTPRRWAAERSRLSFKPPQREAGSTRCSRQPQQRSTLRRQEVRL